MFKKRKENEPASCWVVCSRITTCWALPPFMRMCGIHEKPVQQAWREKVTLCFIIMCIGGMVAFLTIGFSSLLCPEPQRQGAQSFLRYESPAGMSSLFYLLLLSVIDVGYLPVPKNPQAGIQK
jgi:chitin synthase